MIALLVVGLMGLPNAVASASQDAAPTATEHEADGHSAEQGGPGPRVWRVVGDQAAAQFNGGVWRWNECAIPTALPEGYPAPTVPGAIEIKRYPVARRAQVSATTPMAMSGNTGFYPLFGHISRNDIPMTSPVEMDFSDVPEDMREPVEWTMAFLYEGPAQGELGADPADARVEVVETPAMTVLSIGAMGYNRSPDGLRDLEARLQTWLDESDEWIRSGPTRWLGYNGPGMPTRLRWSEVQIPIKPWTPDQKASPDTPNSGSRDG